ncbi:MAG: hypothetical protein GWN00_36735 [Aliifodinibius sp.]|nr:hypothetical protein [Fodinibius sp.]NIV13014.1 hypothetical protein [Fodinibius sp.]NIY30132.1 hypothetical protein [Fodinibius sp.]
MIQISKHVLWILVVLCFLVVPPCDESLAQGITENAYKYVDRRGNIQFASSYAAVPAQYQHPRHMSHGIEQESDAHTQTIQLKDIDADGEQEILASIRTIYPNGRIRDIVEVIKPISNYYVKLVTASADRGMQVNVLDVNQDGRFELYGPHHGGQHEFWVWDDGRYVNIITNDYWRYHELEFLQSIDTNILAGLETVYREWIYRHFARHDESQE